MTAFLPESASLAERRLDDGIEARYAALPLNTFSLMWDPFTIPAQYLAALAWGLSVDTWISGTPEEELRAVTAASTQAHEHKGTERGVKGALDATGALYTYTERPGGAAFRADITIENAASLRITRGVLVATIDNFKRASVHHSYTYSEGLSASVPIATGTTTRRVRTLLLTLEVST